MARTSALDSKVERARELLASGKCLSRRQAARQVGVSADTLKRRGVGTPLGPHGKPKDEQPGVVDHPDGSKTLNTGAGDGSWTPDSILQAHGLDPQEWEVVRVRGNRWGDPDEPNHQLRIDAVPVESLIFAADPADANPLPAPTAPEFGDRSWIWAGDHHAPHQDPSLHRAICSYLNDERPALGILGGDIGDFATVSRHRDTIGFAQSVNEVIDAGYGIIRDYREASPETRWVFLPGNHDDRIEHYIVDKAPAIHSLTIAEESTPVYSLRRLLRLDELGVEVVDTDWERARYPITDSFTARHGYMISENTPQKMLAKHGRSQIQGHSHRLRSTFRTKHDPVDVRVAIEGGCCCLVEDGLGYAAEPDWQPGIVTGYLWDGGNFSHALIPWVAGRLLFPDGRSWSA